MPLLTFLPQEAKPYKKHTTQPTPPRHKQNQQKTQNMDKNKVKGKEKKMKEKEKEKEKEKKKPSSSSSSWDQFKNLLTCKQVEGSQVHDPSKPVAPTNPSSRFGSSCSSICSFRDVVHGNTRVVHRADNSPESSTLGQVTGTLTRKVASGSNSARSLSGSTVRSTHHGGSTSSYSRGMQFGKLSGCYECRMIVDPSRYPYTPRATICACSQCGEVFPKVESLELHQAVRHAVSELGPEDSGRNIVEIIFKSSWLKKDNPICKIERILKVHSTQKTIQRFEDCRDAVKARAHGSNRKNPRCAADGNELLRFHCTSLACSLGARGSSSLCGSVPGCGVCTAIRHGFQSKSGAGVRTTASSGKAHDSLRCTDGRRAMLVCRVIAGKVRRMSPPADDGGASAEEDVGQGGSYDSVAGNAGVYSNLEELFVFNPRAILPCFVVIYKALES